MELLRKSMLQTKQPLFSLMKNCCVQPRQSFFLQTQVRFFAVER